MKRGVQEDFANGKCFLIEQADGAGAAPIAREITPEQCTQARAASKRTGMTAEERAALIDSILDDLAALGLIRQTTKKAGA